MDASSTDAVATTVRAISSQALGYDETAQHPAPPQRPVAGAGKRVMSIGSETVGMKARNRDLFLVIASALLLSACGVEPSRSASPAYVTPSSPSTAIPTPSSTVTPSGAAIEPTCASRPPEPAAYTLVGWRADRIVVIGMTFPSCGEGRYELLSADPLVGTWRSEHVFSDGMPYGASSDGRSVALPASEAITIVDRLGAIHSIPRPAGVESDWDAYGLPPLNGGGYLVTGTQRLLRVASDGSSMRSDPLPAGYVAVAPTSDPDRFILAPVDDARVEYGLSGAPFRAYLWDRTTAALKLLRRSVKRVTPAASRTALAFLVSDGAATTAWSLVRPDGNVQEYATVKGAASLSPDGRLAVLTRRPDTPETGGTVVLDRTTGREIVAVTALPVTGSAWNGDRVAILTQTTVLRTSEPAVFVVEGSSQLRGWLRIPLP